MGEKQENGAVVPLQAGGMVMGKKVQPPASLTTLHKDPQPMGPHPVYCSSWWRRIGTRERLTVGIQDLPGRSLEPPP